MHRTVTKAARCCCCFVCTQVRVRIHPINAHMSVCCVLLIRVLVQRAAAAAACSLHHCAMHLCVSRDVTNGSPSYTTIYFDFKTKVCPVCSRTNAMLFEGAMFVYATTGMFIVWLVIRSKMKKRRLALEE